MFERIVAGWVAENEGRLAKVVLVILEPTSQTRASLEELIRKKSNSEGNSLLEIEGISFFGVLEKLTDGLYFLQSRVSCGSEIAVSGPEVQGLVFNRSGRLIGTQPAEPVVAEKIEAIM